MLLALLRIVTCDCSLIFYLSLCSDAISHLFWQFTVRGRCEKERCFGCAFQYVFLISCSAFYLLPATNCFASQVRKFFKRGIYFVVLWVRSVSFSSWLSIFFSNVILCYNNASYRLMWALDLSSVFCVFFRIHMIWYACAGVDYGATIFAWFNFDMGAYPFVWASKRVLLLCVVFYVRRRFKCFRFTLFRSLWMMEWLSYFFSFSLFYFVTSSRSPQIHLEHPNCLNQEFSDWHICVLFNDDNLIVHIFATLFLWRDWRETNYRERFDGTQCDSKNWTYFLFLLRSFTMLTNYFSFHCDKSIRILSYFHLSSNDNDRHIHNNTHKCRLNSFYFVAVRGLSLEYMPLYWMRIMWMYDTFLKKR